MPHVNSVLRLNMTLPGLDPELLATMYAASLDMAAFADSAGFTAVTTDEHHGADDGCMPATLVYTGMLAARTSRIAVAVQALLLPLHDPLQGREPESMPRKFVWRCRRVKGLNSRCACAMSNPAPLSLTHIQVRPSRCSE